MLLLLKLVSCRHMIIGLCSFIISWSSSSLLKNPFMFHWMMFLIILFIIKLIRYYSEEGRVEYWVFVLIKYVEIG